MPIKVGDKLPDGQLQEFIEVETAGCSIGPNTFNVADLVDPSFAEKAATTLGPYQPR